MPSRQSRSLSFCLFLCLLATVITSMPAGAQTTAPNEWTWMGGSSTVPTSGNCVSSGIYCGPPAVYGTLGQPDPGNAPGGRVGSVSWTDKSGNFWLFGGYSFDSADNWGYFNDLWEFNPTTKEWAWMSGSNSFTAFCTNGGTACGKPGVYGVLQTPAPGNTPGSRELALSWLDHDGNLWLFGGAGYDANGSYGNLNDLWKYSPTIGEWAWMGGNNVLSSAGFVAGVYRTLGSLTAGSYPGSRNSAVAWTDSDGNLWLFGGYGQDSLGQHGDLNDLWKFVPSTLQWAWMGGSSTIPGDWEGVPGVYGQLGVPAAGNIPGGRVSAISWVDIDGNFWLFSGNGFASTPSGTFTNGFLNDLWKFNPSINEWTWMGGSSTFANSCATLTGPTCLGAGVYGTLGSPAPGNIPGSREGSGTWTDSVGNLWLFGGSGYDANGVGGFLNDLWMFNSSTSEWAWMGGSNTNIRNGGYAGVYGTFGVPSAANTPGSGGPAAAWVDLNGNAWLFGGDGLDSAGRAGVQNSLWEFQSPAATPAFSVAAGTYQTAQTVTISDATPGANLFYTTDGSLPTTSSAQYLQPIQVSSSETVQAIAFAPGYSPSAVASAAYAISSTNTQQTIDFSPIPSTLVFGVSPMTLSAKASSGLPVTFNVLSGPATTNGSILTIAGAGTVVIAADQAGNATYAAAEALQVVVVNRATATITVTPYNVGYDGNPHTAAGTATGVGGVNLIGDLTLSGTTHVSAGSYPMDAWSFHDPNGNYADASGTVNDMINSMVATVTAGSYLGVYDGSTHAPAACTLTGTYVGSLSCTNNPALVGPGVGAGVVTPTVTGFVLPNVAVTKVSGTWSITKATSAVTVSCPASVVYIGSAQTPCTASATGAGSMNVPLTVIYANNTNVGIATASAIFAGDANHTASSTVVNFAIVPSPVTVTAGSYSGVYDGSMHSVPACLVTGAYKGSLSCLNSPASVGSGLGAGVVTPVVSGGTPNFVITMVNGTWSITQAVASVTLGNLMQIYTGTPMPVTVTTLPTGLGATVLYSGPSYPSSATPPTNPGSYTVTATVTSPNYTGTTTGTLVISPANAGLTLQLRSGMAEPSPYGTTAYFDLVQTGPTCPTGTVQFYVDGASSGSAVALNGSSCSSPVTFATAALAPGVHSVYAAYSGDAFYSPGNSNTATHAVTAEATSVTLATSVTVVNVGQQVNLMATVTPTYLDPGAQGPAGTVEFFDAGTSLGVVAVSNGSPYMAALTTSSLAAGMHSISATYVSSNGEFTGSSSAIALKVMVSKVAPAIIWSNPGSIAYGTALSGTQLNATAKDPTTNASVAGTFVYTPPAGTVLSAGVVNLMVNFIPTDTATYSTQSATVTLTVAPATPTLNWSTPAAIVYGTSLSGTQLNATSSTLGTFVYTPSTGAVPAAGSQTLSVTFTPTDKTNYTTATQSVNLQVNKAVLTVAATNASVPYNQAIPSLNYTTTGYLNGDSSTVLGGAPLESTTAKQGSAIGSYPITIAQGTLSAANHSFQFQNGTLTISSLGTTATPVISPAGGTYTSARSVTITDATAGASIYYTTDGSTPTTSSTKYSAAINVSATETIKAIAVAPGYSQSVVASAAYTINLPATATPTFTPGAGTYNSTQSVTIADKTSGAVIYYTTDGSTPTTSSTKYAGAITVSSTQTIKAIALASGSSQSAVATAAYSITQPAATPTFSPASGTYTSAQTVFISDATAGATIYYTTNGSTPTTSTAKYTSAGITVSATETIKAIAVATGYTQSSVASASYVIATAPTVATSAATNLSTSGATLNGVVTANNASTQYWFMWGTNKSALTKTTTAVSGLNGATAKSVTAALTGLTTKTTYYFQLVASNAAGKSSGTVVAFTTK